MRITLFFIFILLQFMVLRGQQSTATAQVSSFTVDAPQLGGQKKIWVYLPVDYESSNKHFPVLYMHDAQNVFDAHTSFSGEWQVDETLDSLKAEVIVIGIEHGNDKRIDELTPYRNEKYGGGKADDYLEFIVKTLKPQIDTRYRTKPDGPDTGIMGSSLGGLVSFYAALKFPDVFGKVGVFSPSFWFSPEIYTLAENTQKVNAHIYFACGDSESEDMVTDMKRMIGIIETKQGSEARILNETVVIGGQHNEKLWRDSFAKAFEWLFK